MFSLNVNNLFSLALAAAAKHTCRRALSAVQLELSAVVFQQGCLGSLLLFQFPCREQKEKHKMRIITAVTERR